MVKVSPQVPLDVSAVIRRWFPEPRADPWATVVRTVAREVRPSDLNRDRATLKSAFDDFAVAALPGKRAQAFGALLREREEGIAARDLRSTRKSGGGSWGGGDWFDNDDGDWDFD